MIIDAHVHIFPGKIVTNAVKELERQYSVNAIGSATVPGIRSGMNKANVDASVLLSVATRPDQVESINSWISGICKDYPGIIPLGAMHPEHPDPEAESMWMRQPGIKLRGQRAWTSVLSVQGILMMLDDLYLIRFGILCYF